MSEGLNRVTLLGNLGADPDLRYGEGGADTAVLKLRLATTESYFDKRSNERKERTDWHNVTVFGKRGEALGKILAKGSTILVEGRLQTSSYEKNGEKRYSTDVIATNIVLTGGKRDGAARPYGTSGHGASVKHTATPERDDFAPDHSDDGIPFVSQADTIADWLR